MNEITEILTISSDFKELRKVEKFLLNIFRERKISKNCYNKIYLCVSEAVVNSIEHGNKSDKRKEVKIQINCKSDKIILEVTDEGEGFNVETVKDPTKKENIRKETGRGIFIMKSLSNSVEYNEYGNSVKIKISLK